MEHKKIILVTEEKLDKYSKITSEALKIAEKAIAEGKEKEAKEIIEMASCYLSDAGHFEKQGDYVNAFACLNYAHGWLDAGARLKVFNVKDRRLFAV